MTVVQHSWTNTLGFDPNILRLLMQHFYHFLLHPNALDITFPKKIILFFSSKDSTYELAILISQTNSSNTNLL